MTASAQWQALVQQHTGDARWGAHATRIANGDMWHPPRPGGHDDQAHPPIHPTRYTQGEANWPQEKARPSSAFLLDTSLLHSVYSPQHFWLAVYLQLRLTMPAGPEPSQCTCTCIHEQVVVQG